MDVISHKIRKLTSETLKHELNHKIKNQDLNSYTTLEVKLFRLQNFTGSYIDMKVKPHKSSGSKSHNVILRAKSPPISVSLHHSIAKSCESTSHPDSQKGSNSSSTSKKSSKSFRTSSSTK